MRGFFAFEAGGEELVGGVGVEDLMQMPPDQRQFPGVQLGSVPADCEPKQDVFPFGAQFRADLRGQIGRPPARSRRPPASGIAPSRAASAATGAARRRFHVPDEAGRHPAG